MTLSNSNRRRVVVVTIARRIDDRRGVDLKIARSLFAERLQHVDAVTFPELLASGLGLLDHVVQRSQLSLHEDLLERCHLSGDLGRRHRPQPEIAEQVGVQTDLDDAFTESSALVADVPRNLCESQEYLSR